MILDIILGKGWRNHLDPPHSVPIMVFLSAIQSLEEFQGCDGIALTSKLPT